MKRKILLALAAVGLVCIGFALQHQREQAIQHRPMLRVSFEHFNHAKVQCATCHHNFLDDTGAGTCYSCHKELPALAQVMEPMFHDFCENCHIEKAEEGEKHGPVRRCSSCHNDNHGF